MKFICVRECFTNHESPIHVHYDRGQVVEFEECPDHFVSLDGAIDDSVKAPKRQELSGPPQAAGETFDFNNAGEEVLLVADYDVNKLSEFSQANYGVEIPFDSNKAVMVAKFVDARYRHAATKDGLANAVQNILK